MGAEGQKAGNSTETPARSLLQRWRQGLEVRQRIGGEMEGFRNMWLEGRPGIGDGQAGASEGDGDEGSHPASLSRRLGTCHLPRLCISVFPHLRSGSKILTSPISQSCFDD